MCRYWGIGIDIYRYRIDSGWGLKRVLETPVTGGGKAVKDHKGKRYSSISKMGMAYGIDKYNYNTRVQQGWSLKDILTKPVRKNCKKCKDHLGNEYDKLKDMCAAYKISVDTYKQRIKSGYSVEEALTVPIKVTCRHNTNRVYDHLGNGYSSGNEMLKRYGISYNNYYRRKRNGWSLKDILTISVNNQDSSIQCRDKNGNTYESIVSMCRGKGISHSTYKRRLLKGKPVDKALEVKSYSDHLGNKYDTIKNMCEAYNINDMTFRNRVQQGWSLKDSLTKPVKGR